MLVLFLCPEMRKKGLNYFWFQLDQQIDELKSYIPAKMAAIPPEMLEKGIKNAAKGANLQYSKTIPGKLKWINLQNKEKKLAIRFKNLFNIYIAYLVL